MRLLPLLFLSALPALADFSATEQRVRLSFGQKEAQCIFTYDAQQEIDEASPLCDCTTIRLRHGKLIATVDTSTFDRDTEKHIDVRWENGHTTRLTMRFSVPQAILLSARSFRWKLGEKPRPQVLTITLPPGSPIGSITEAALSGEAFDYAPAMVERGRRYTVTLTPRSTALPVLNRLLIHTDSPDPRYRRHIIYLQVKK